MEGFEDQKVCERLVTGLDMGATGHGEYKGHDQEGRDPLAERLDASVRSHSDHVPIIPRIP